MNEETTRVMAKIRKLLARADEGRNDNEHEREIAMRQANALLAKHGLNMAEVSDQDEPQDFGAKGKLDVKTKRCVWRGMIFSQIGKLNGCFVMRTRGSGTIHIIGRAMRCTVTRQLAEYVIASIDREARAVHRREYPGMNGRSFITNFGVGAAGGIATQVSDILRAQAEGNIGDTQVSRSQAMVIVDQHKQAIVEAKETTREIFGGWSRSSYSGGRGAGTSEGRAYGSSLSLNAQVGGRAQRRLAG